MECVGWDARQESGWTVWVESIGMMSGVLVTGGVGWGAAAVSGAAAPVRGRRGVRAQPARRWAATMSSEPINLGKVTLKIQGKGGLEVTDAMREAIRDKIGGAILNFEGVVKRVDVHCGVRGHAKQHVAEATIRTTHGTVRSEVEQESLYASLDVLADKVSRQLRKVKERHGQLSRKQKGEKTSEATSDELIDSDEFGIDRALVVGALPENQPAIAAGTVVRKKYYDMPPLTVDEAIEALSLIDHDFYMFRDASSGEIATVYERTHGGYGIIYPRPDE